LTPDQVYSAPEWHGFPPTHPKRDVSLGITFCDIYCVEHEPDSPRVSNAVPKGSLASRGANWSAFRATPAEPTRLAKVIPARILLVPRKRV
jgi:hypothetical protein